MNRRKRVGIVKVGPNGKFQQDHVQNLIESRTIERLEAIESNTGKILEILAKWDAEKALEVLEEEQ